MRALRLIAGPRARERIVRDGLRAEAVAGVAAAAGGPKGLAFLPLDAWLFGEWLASAPRARLLAGASIGAWRMAAAVHPDGPGATRRLGEAYLELQRYPAKPSPRLVAGTCRAVVEATIGDPARFVAGAS
ncbi:MAG: patatin-like phospholipase family protein, partial [Burkholderiales bacterium]|nr:patatin-like phospholipase family protein [Burkholderiales bacterium]